MRVAGLNPVIAAGLLLARRIPHHQTHPYHCVC